MEKLLQKSIGTKVERKVKSSNFILMLNKGSPFQIETPLKSLLFPILLFLYFLSVKVIPY